MTIRSEDLLLEADATRVLTNTALAETTRSPLGQFMTSSVVASFMASMFQQLGSEVRLLDAGAGVGSLTAGAVQEVLGRKPLPTSITVTAYEVDRVMLAGLRSVLLNCQRAAQSKGVSFTARVLERDFIEDAAAALDGGMFADSSASRFNLAILNPPYRKLSSKSRERSLLRGVGIETTNLYAAFVALAFKLLDPGGELVAITPRSFCNGPYFLPFRRLLLEQAALLRVHVFDSRKRAFRDDAVLQENIIFHARKGAPRGKVMLSSSAAPGEDVEQRIVPHSAVVDPKDPNAFIHLATSNEDAILAKRMTSLPCVLDDLALTVSTGRVIDFRARAFLRASPGARTVPLIYPTHFRDGFVAWPKLGGRKANALVDEGATQALMVPNETYVLTKRFTSKEERRRVVAVVCEPTRLPAGTAQVGIENHVNYFHSCGRGLTTLVARGLAAYLNSSLVDRYFRQFNGHTQVNATDLRSIRYPDLAALKAMGKRIGKAFPAQDGIDAIVDEALA
ncbi:MAG: Eco57I restriction-modification methylase domain-containing protein [Planctomycetaceae bacterium]|nr:Eco57I restriction-modification methylase domain-containing protein [Planctomycetaceae bacterium]